MRNDTIEKQDGYKLGNLILEKARENDMNDSTNHDRLSEIQKQYIADHYEYLQKEYASHKGDWLTDSACMEYHRQAKTMNGFGKQDIGEKRKLREELQERYGLLETEAINILDGVRSRDYIEKYKLIHAIQNADEWIKPYLDSAKKKGEKNGDAESK